MYIAVITKTDKEVSFNTLHEAIEYLVSAKENGWVMDSDDRNICRVRVDSEPIAIDLLDSSRKKEVESLSSDYAVSCKKRSRKTVNQTLLTDLNVQGDLTFGNVSQIANID